MSATIGTPAVGFVDKRKTQGQLAGVVATPANYASDATLDARLTAISGTTYTAARLRAMTWNDKVYAVRLSDDAAGV
jgi:hypothetical protein